MREPPNRIKVRFFAVLSLLLCGWIALAAPQGLRSYHATTGEVLSVTANATQITFRTSDGRVYTLPVEERALEQISNFSPGDPVTLSCRDFQPGEHFAIFDIAPRARP